jgi:hypothetical protein
MAVGKRMEGDLVWPAAPADNPPPEKGGLTSAPPAAAAAAAAVAGALLAPKRKKGGGMERVGTLEALCAGERRLRFLLAIKQQSTPTAARGEAAPAVPPAGCEAAWPPLQHLPQMLSLLAPACRL